MTEKIKYAIIGAGCMGQEHILNIGIIDDAEVVALCDTSEQSIQESLEPVSYTHLTLPTKA